jgi:hypothetical protein
MELLPTLTGLGSDVVSHVCRRWSRNRWRLSTFTRLICNPYEANMFQLV